jgi:ADP-ribosylglycohydrolase
VTRDPISQRFFNVVAASRVGDAMGTPTEGLSPQQISTQFGWVTGFEGDGTDDSLMATILAEALQETGGFATADDWALKIHHHRLEILEKQDKFFVSILQLVEKLEVGYRPADVAVGNMPSTSSAMCIWPVALVNAGRPAAAAAQAYELADLIHVNEADHCTDAAAALAAAIASALLPGASIGSAIEEAIRVIRPTSGTLFRDTLLETAQLASAVDSYAEFRTQYQERFERPIFCDSLETVPAAFGLAVLAKGDVRAAVEYGANFGRDADTIASMAGALCGALSDDIPTTWTETLGADAVLSAEQVADALLATARVRLATETERARVAAGILGGS